MTVIARRLLSNRLRLLTLRMPRTSLMVGALSATSNEGPIIKHNQ